LVSAVLLAVVFVAMGGGGRLLRRFAGPVGELVDAAHQIEAGDLSVRVRERGPGEVRSVARAFNAMTTQLEATDARRRQLLADITHELGTPLSVIRGRAEGILEGVYPGDAEHVAPVLEAARTLQVIIEDLRTLALAEAGGLALRREPVDLGLLANQTIALFRDDAHAREVRLAAEVPEALAPVNADPARLQSVLSNLVTNALRHTPAGGSVTITAAVAGDHVEVRVADTGSGIPAEMLPHVFDRFVKDAASGGSGLGLAIARDLVRAHGGTIAATAGPSGGTVVRFTLPV
jgi:two-component system sensor histidine kinase BaeS